MDGATGGSTDAGRIADGLEALTRWSAALSWSDVPAAIRSRAAVVLADDLAAIIAARAEPEVIALHDGMASSSGGAEATVFNARGQRLDRYSAAVANGSAADWCELDEGYRRVICHAGLYSVPAILAEAEATGATGEDVLRALVIGYETAARIARAFSYSTLTLHPHGSLAAVGAAASVAALRRLSAEGTAAALNAAATLVVPGPFNHTVEGALVRNVWPGVGAWSGLRAVDWSSVGIAGRREGLHDVYAAAFGGTPHPGELTEDLGQAWALVDGYHKIHACCQYAHSAVEATLGLIHDLGDCGDDTDAIARIHIDTHWKGQHLDNVHPKTTLAAKFSMQHILATTARFGHAGADAFHASTLSDPAIAALREKVTIGAWEPEPGWPNDRPARVIWEMRDGSRHAEECLSARGGPDRPFAPDEIHGKIMGIITDPYPAMPAVIERLLAVDPGLLDQRWDETVALMTAGARP
ncbi:MAG: MmgE/PrpD family protein [Alphaproteobacteria bacterium]|nr:MmgE/PrpD family protein [Alphaproteobacteria bacterium]